MDQKTAADRQADRHRHGAPGPRQVTRRWLSGSPHNCSRAASGWRSTFLKLFGFEVYLPRVRRYQMRWHRRVEILRPYFPGYGFTRIELQWHSVQRVPGVIRVVRIGADTPTRVPDEVIDALRARERDGAIDLPANDKRRRVPRIGDRVQIVSGPFVGHSGLCTEVSRQQVGVLLLMFKAQRPVRLHRDAVELV